MYEQQIFQRYQITMCHTGMPRYKKKSPNILRGIKLIIIKLIEAMQTIPTGLNTCRTILTVALLRIVKSRSRNFLNADRSNTI